MAYKGWIAAGAVLCACGAQSANRTAIEDDGGSTSDSGADTGVAPSDGASEGGDTSVGPPDGPDGGPSPAEAGADVASDATGAADGAVSLAIKPAPFTPFQGIGFSGWVALWETAPSGSWSYQTTVDWGDGTPPTTTGPIPYNTQPDYIPAMHTYAKSGSATVTVTVVDPATGAGAQTSYPIRIGILLSDFSENVYAVAVDSTDVYWGSFDKVAKTPIGGGASTTLFLVQGPFDSGGLAVYGGNLYASALGGIVKCAVGGCNGHPTTLAPFSGAASLAVDSQNVYWTDSAARANGAIYACAAGGCGNNPTTFASAQPFPMSVVSDSKNVYWTNGGVSADGGTNLGTVMTCPVSGCTQPETLASGQSGPWWLAIDANSVYWADNLPSGGFANGSIQKCPLSGCGAGPSVLASGDATAGVGGLTIDSTYVYWGERGVSRVPLGGGTPEVLTAPYQGSAAVQAVDDANVYYLQYTAGAQGQLVQIAK